MGDDTNKFTLGNKRVLVAIPAYNEETTVAKVIADVKGSIPNLDVLVIDDGSDDNTAVAAKLAGAHTLTLPFNVGVGGAMRTAFLYAKQNQYDSVVQVDADGQHDPAQLPVLLKGLESASVVVGSRFASGSSYSVHGPRKWAMVLLSTYLSHTVGTELNDTTSGFRAADKKAIDLFAKHYPSEYLGDTVESLVIAKRHGLQIIQVPVTMRERQGGQPSQGGFKSTLYLTRAILAMVVALTRKRVTGGAP